MLEYQGDILITTPEIGFRASQFDILPLLQLIIKAPKTHCRFMTCPGVEMSYAPQLNALLQHTTKNYNTV